LKFCGGSHYYSIVPAIQIAEKVEQVVVVNPIYPALNGEQKLYLFAVPALFPEIQKNTVLPEKSSMNAYAAYLPFS
jgi:hypothetical protein